MATLSFVQMALTWLGLTLSQGPTTSQEGQGVWSGRLLASASPSALYSSSRGLTLVSQTARWSREGIAADGFGASACGVGKHALLAVTVRHESGHKLLTLAQETEDSYAVRQEVALPDAPAGKPVPIRSEDGCSFGVLLVDGTVVVAKGEVLESFPQASSKVLDVRESPLGFAGCATPKGRLVMATPDGLVTWDVVQGRSEKFAVSGGVAGQMVAARNEELVFVLSKAGALLSYRPFESAPLEVASSRGAAPSGLSVWKADNGQSLIWATVAGLIYQFDGSEARELAAFSSGIRMPLLSADVLDVGRPQILAALDDGSLGIVFVSSEGVSAERIESVARPKLPPIIVATSDTEAARWMTSSGVESLSYTLGQPTAQPVARADASLSAGEMILDAVSSVQTTTVSASSQGLPAKPSEGTSEVGGGVGETTDEVEREVEAERVASVGKKTAAPRLSQNTKTQIARIGGGGCSVGAIRGDKGLAKLGLALLISCLLVRRGFRNRYFASLR